MNPAATNDEIYQTIFMAIQTRGKEARPFPALVIASLLFLACLYPGQSLIAPLVPGISGEATIDPSLIVFDIPIHLPLTIDLLLVAVLFFLVYALVILLYPSGLGGTTWRQTGTRLGAVAKASFFFLLAAAVGGFISFLVHDHLPKNIRNGVDSLGIAADISLPFSAFKTIHLPGNVITLLGLIVGFAIAVAKISSTPGIKKTAPLTREQRMTPYQRIQKEKKQAGTPPAPVSTPKQAGTKVARKKRSSDVPTIPGQSAPGQRDTRPLCQNRPLPTLEPEAVAYMPMR